MKCKQSQPLGRLSFLVATILLMFLTPLHTQAQVHAGQSLRAALQDLNQRGAKLMFSSKLVEDDMQVETQPTAGSLIDIAREILAPHQLALEPGPAGRWLVIPVKEQTSKSSIEISGRVIDGDSGKPIAGAKIKNEAQTVTATADGDFSMANLLSSDIRIEAEGYNSRNFAVTTEPQFVFRLEATQPEEIMVMASRYMLSGRNSTAELNHNEIDRLPHLADDVIRAVHRLPAVTANDLSAQFSLRGGFPEETALRLDGLELIDPFHLKDLTGVFSIIDSNLVESVEVLPGGFPAQFGNYASGVVNINSLPPPEESVHSVGLSFINSFVNTRGSFNERRGGWLASLRRGYLDLLVDDNGSEVFSPKYLDAFATIEHDIGKHHSASIHVLAAREDFDLSDVNFNAANADIQLEGNSDTLFVWTRFKSQWHDRLQSDHALWSSRLGRTRDIIVDDPSDTSSDLFDDRKFNEIGIRSDWQWRVNDLWILKFGAEFEDHTAEYDYRLSSTTNLALYPGQLPINRQTRRNVTGDTYGVYAAIHRTLGRLNAELGWRWDAEGYTGLNENLASPRLALQYELGDRTRLTASWGNYNQFQPAESLQVEDGIENFFPATRTKHRNIGLEHQLGRAFVLRAEVYQKRYRDLRPYYTNLLDGLEPVPEANPDRIRVDASSAEATGIELTMKYRSNEELSLWATYALSRSEDRVNGRDVARDWDQRHAANLIANWRGEKWNFNAAARWHSGWPRTTVALGNVQTANGTQLGVVPGQRNADNYNDYSRVDVRISRDVQLKRSEFTYYFEVYNLFDSRNICCVDDIDIAAGPVLELDEEDWGGILPSFGFTWTFH